MLIKFVRKGTGVNNAIFEIDHIYWSREIIKKTDPMMSSNELNFISSEEHIPWLDYYRVIIKIKNGQETVARTREFYLMNDNGETIEYFHSHKNINLE